MGKYGGMSSLELRSEILECRKGMTGLFYRLRDAFSTESVVCDLMTERRYISDEMFNTLKTKGLFYVDDYRVFKAMFSDISDDDLKKYGMLSDSGVFLLEGRYTLPIWDFSGTQVVALVGWSRFGRKYITTSSFGFSRDACFFGYECNREALERGVCVVEGVFDTVALQSIGIPTLGVMGLELSKVKENILKRYPKVVIIPDMDNAGRRVSPYLNRVSGKSTKSVWGVDNALWVKVDVGGIKDMDDLVREYDCVEDLNVLLCKEGSIKFAKLS